jgi:hypothetical protein
MEFPEVISPAELAKRLGWSERRIRVLAREVGACRILGNRMALTSRRSFLFADLLWSTESDRCDMCLIVVIVANIRATQNAPINAENIKRESITGLQFT